jgi:transcriptional regulator with PAS, ATPase and Fis domain
MYNENWVKGFYGAITICDDQGIILAMNEHSEKTFADQGGRTLIGKSLFDCHHDSSNRKIRKMLETQQPNIYIVEKNGEKKIILQAPWYEEGQTLGGLVEISIPFSGEIPVIKR